ncbi:molybdenum cofactor guanylyltransferase [Erythrobacter sp. JK5]|uniref:molybdenum cofactor guanylyltransferase n=1 Tax=Erythrobacter sp. JK5 TaxID=2829500 RepID=UPI001BA56E2E|nr:molybdenum cofactor guanylyltransferase [Erythrobacter sp. JK5]QUL39045.1 molybdenum cofactor guanylyltransferase [Erythrobacter sp. JK5]
MTDATPTIVIAAGGEGRRMGGSKPAQILAGKSLLDHALHWAGKHSDLIAIAVRDSDQLEHTSIPILVDAAAGLGPISALKSAFSFAEKHDRDQVLLIGCDLPFLPSDLAERLAREIGSQCCAMPVSNGRDHPMTALWRVERTALEAFVAAGGRSIWRFAESVGVKRIDWAPEQGTDPFTNINDLETLARAEGRLRQP